MDRDGLKLEPCPFCGGSVTLEEAEPTRTVESGQRRWWGVVCRNTSNLGGTCAIEQRPSASKEAAIERWNRRDLAAQGLRRERVIEECARICDPQDESGNPKGDALTMSIWEGRAKAIRSLAQRPEGDDPARLSTLPTCPDCGAGNRLNGRLIHVAGCRQEEFPAPAEAVKMDALDARRYQWLRASWLDKDKGQMSSVQIYGDELAFEELDAAIDKAMLAAAPERGEGGGT